MAERINKKQRFTQALTLICGAVPPARMVDDWLSKESDDLQDWVGRSACPWWLQNIGAIDAAEVMAETPTEGEPCVIDYEN